MNNKVLFLDFDGVLFDTLKEVYLVNRRLYLGVDLFSEVDEKNYQLYSKYKYLVYNIWMFYYYNPILSESSGCDFCLCFVSGGLPRDAGDVYKKVEDTFILSDFYHGNSYFDKLFYRIGFSD